MRRVAFLTAVVLLIAVGRVTAQAVGAEFRVNTYTSGDQDEPGIGMDATGAFVVTWRGHGPSGAQNGPRAQRYNAAGAPVGTEFQVNQATYYFTNGGVAVGSAPDGRFVVAWAMYGPDGDKLGVFGQRFTSAAAPAGEQFRVNTYTTADQSAPKVAVDGGGGFVVIWNSRGQDSEHDGVFGQRYAASGAALDTEFRVNSYTTQDQTNAHVATSSTGDFVVVWRSPDPAGGSGIFGQRYASSGAPRGDEFRANGTTSVYNGIPAVASDPAGNFLVVWRTVNGPSEILGRRYGSSGVPQASEFRVNTYTTGNQFWVAIAAAGSSGFVVTWISDDNVVRGQRYTPACDPFGIEFRANTYTTGLHWDVQAGASGGGKFVIAWVATGEDTSGYGIFGRKFSAGLLNGDVNADGSVDVNDIFYLINSLFAAGPAPLGPADVNGDQQVNVNDVFYLINYLFAQGQAPV